MKENNKIQLSDHFTYGKMMRFTLPPVVMMIFTSIYGVVDGFFVSNFVGKSAFTAVYFLVAGVFIFGGGGVFFWPRGRALVF